MTATAILAYLDQLDDEAKTEADRLYFQRIRERYLAGQIGFRCAVRELISWFIARTTK